MSSQMQKDKVCVFWFRRDLRLDDNTGLYQALKSEQPVLPIFIFDENILNTLPVNDARATFIYERLSVINNELRKKGASLKVLKGKPIEEWKKLLKEFEIEAVYTNKDYEPYANERDKRIEDLLNANEISWQVFKDQVIFEENEVLKSDGKPYTVYTPYKNKWLEYFDKSCIEEQQTHDVGQYYQCNFDFPELSKIGFQKSVIKVQGFNISDLKDYPKKRDIPAASATSLLSPHLRFGTISIREVIRRLSKSDEVFLSELIWREFFMQILFHFPKVVKENFHSKYDGINWRNNESDFKRWCEGNTGFPMVDAGMRELNHTGFMHNRVRMVVASFLCKHLLIDWRWGEAYFAEKLLDYELASNNGNWQWAAGTGCDAAPYFRIFNPHTQLKKFDHNLEYVRKWVPEYDTLKYPQEMVEHKAARERALRVYKAGINS